MNLKAIAGAAALTLLAAGAADASILRYTAILKGAGETPPNAAPGRGVINAVLDTDTRELDYTVTVSRLTGPVTTAGFKEAASPPDDPIVTAPAPGHDGTIHAVARLTAAQVKALNAGQWWFDVGTAANPGGEIRGKLTRTSG
jgi:hypothetical protein